MATTMTFSHFLRQSGEVLEQIEDHDVLLERRDGENIVLKRADRVQAEHDSLVAAGRMMAWMFRRQQLRGEVLEQIKIVAPWASFLPKPAIEDFVREFTETIAACAELDDFAPVGVVLKQWKNTAEVYANPALLMRLRAPLEPGEAVTRPGSGG